LAFGANGSKFCSAQGASRAHAHSYVIEKERCAGLNLASVAQSVKFHHVLRLKNKTMDKKNLSELTDEELLVEKKKLKKSKLMNAAAIGFLAGVVIYGIVTMVISKKFVILIPLLFPIYFIYRLLGNSKKNNELEDLLKERNLN
jgi:hypothetical protein